jgi:hypothetical protein
MGRVVEVTNMTRAIASHLLAVVEVACGLAIGWWLIVALGAP